MPGFRILSWNILHGGGSRCEQILESIERFDADIVALQEFRHGKHGAVLLNCLNRIGYSEIYAPETDNARQNTLIIVSRLPMRCDTFPQSGVRNARGITAEIELTATLTLNMISLHMPQKQAQIPYFSSLLDLPPQWVGGHSLVIGDLNCGIPFEDSQTKTFYATHLFQQLLSNGWIDSWRSRNLEAREFSWVSTRKGNGFRYDHALTSSLVDEVVANVGYDHTVRDNKISDHSSLMLELEW